MTDGDALLRAILLQPAEDVPRLGYADWLEEHATTETCGACKGAGGHEDPVGGYSTFSGPYPMWDRCHLCDGTGYVSNGFAERAEFIRVQVELAKMGDKHHQIGRNEIDGFVYLRKWGDGFWTFTSMDDATFRAVKIGDRIDVFGCTVRGKKKMRHGLVVRRVDDRGSDGIEYAVARDAESKPWAGRELAERSAALFADGRGAWFDVLGQNRPLLRSGSTNVLEYYAGGRGVVLSTVVRGFPESLTLSLAAWSDDLARAVWSRWPVTRVEFTDAEVVPFSGSLPPVGWVLQNIPLWSSRNLKAIHYIFPTSEAALDALSRGAVSRGRELAGLTGPTAVGVCRG